jgi:hypothetical protein
MQAIIGYLKESRMGGPILLGVAAGAGLLFLVYRDRFFLYGLACYFAVVGGMVLVSLVIRNRHGKLGKTR